MLLKSEIFSSLEQLTALLDVILSEFRERQQVTSFCSVGIEGTVAVEVGGDVAQGKVIVIGHLNAEQD